VNTDEKREGEEGAGKRKDWKKKGTSCKVGFVSI
jgi:hypothetical protein